MTSSIAYILAIDWLSMMASRIPQWVSINLMLNPRERAHSLIGGATCCIRALRSTSVSIDRTKNNWQNRLYCNKKSGVKVITNDHLNACRSAARHAPIYTKHRHTLYTKHLDKCYCHLSCHLLWRVWINIHSPIFICPCLVSVNSCQSILWQSGNVPFSGA